jgi:hypothetical protein
MLTGDIPLLVNYGVALTLNTSIIISALYFRRQSMSPKSDSSDPTEKLVKKNSEEKDEKEN